MAKCKINKEMATEYLSLKTDLVIKEIGFREILMDLGEWSMSKEMSLRVSGKME